MGYGTDLASAGNLRCIAQHAIILKLANHFGVQENCFVQDPIYDEVDKEVLTRRGMTILDDPQGFLEVDDDTIFFSCCPNVPVR